MRNKSFVIAFSSIFLFCLFFISPSIRAAEPVPGDACSTQYLIAATGGPETTGIRNLMVCNGATWQQLTTWLANGYVGIKTATPAAPLHVNGEVIVGATTGIACGPTITGGLRWSSAGETIEICDGINWREISVSTCDSSPAFFTFTAQNSLGPSSVYSSNIAAVTGMDAGCNATVGVSGQGTPEYRVCSTSNCSSVDITWTTSNNSVAMQGKYIQLRATTAATAGTTHTITASIGPVSSDWSITTTPTDCSTGAIGTVCADGSVYAGTTPDGNVPMYVTRCDYNMTWNGSACINPRPTVTWNNGQSDFVDTSLINCGSAPACDNSGETNTTTLAAADSDSNDAGLQPHAAAKVCDDMTVHGNSDWYLPSIMELNVIFGNKAAVGNFDSGGAAGYWSSSERHMNEAWFQWFTSGSQATSGKNNVGYIRCARK
ncbi:Lcl domain-containing protein [Nitrosospira multiformis]|uniref:Lcl C-terminal domain-containing protein n=1 Tax=Nitrosospira multiformis TaxID=1231 RepID=A0A1I7FSR4_9PROT|nr:DUF1566 domain-containing protein [Nitrosospira multiformis]SFU39259.1 Protein of unknown function [Nitrosospira multiformis]